MRLKNGVESVIILPKDITIVSIRDDRIVLPYVGAIWGDVLAEVNMTATDAAPMEKFDFCNEQYTYDDLIKNERVYITFSPQNGYVKTCVQVEVETRWGDLLSKRIAAPCYPAEIKMILDAFFSNGAQGLRSEYAKNLKAKFENWKWLEAAGKI